jgi:serine/threonine-protein kinase
MTGVPSRRGRVGSVINGKWQVDARIGQGGMSTVYAATHKNNGSRAALKILHADLAREPEIKSRFLREGYVGNQVRHPGVVEVIDDDVTEQGEVYLVVELLEGETLEAARVASNGRLPLDRVLKYSVQVLEALSAAHAAGVVHRDLKPDNLFLTTAGRVKILDFGLARLLEGVPGAETTRTGVMIGTPEFMAPEQATARRDEIDAQSDVWGLGATMYTLITGKHIHDAGSIREHLIAAATRRAPPIRDLAPYVPPAIAAVIDRATQFEKSDRFPDARSMLAALEGAQAAQRPRMMSRPDPIAPVSVRSSAQDSDVFTSAASKPGARLTPPGKAAQGAEHAPSNADDEATLMTDMTRELHARLSGDQPFDVEHADTVVALPDEHPGPPPPTPRMPSAPPSQASPAPRIPPAPHTEPTVTTKQHKEPMPQRADGNLLADVPPPSSRGPLSSYMDGPQYMQSAPNLGATGSGSSPIIRPSHGGDVGGKRVSVPLIIVVAVISLLVAAGATFFAMRYIKPR